MNSDRSEEHVTALLGAHVVDQLDDDERHTVLTHLEHCPACRADYDYIRAVPAYLRLLTPELVADLMPHPSAAPATPAVVVPIRTARPRGALLAAAAVVVLASAAGVAWLIEPLGHPGGPSGPQVPVVDASAGNLGVNASVTVQPADHDVAIQATITGLTNGQSYDLILTTLTGHTITIASFVADGTTHIARGNAATTVDQIGFFALVLHDGATVVIVPFSGAVPHGG